MYGVGGFPILHACPVPVRAGRRHGSNMWEGYGMCTVWEGSPYYMRALCL